MGIIRTMGVAITSTKIGAKIATSLYHPLDKLVFRMSRGQYTLVGLVTGLPMVVITTIGAKTGLERKMPLLYFKAKQDDKHFAIIASNFGNTKFPGWYHNMKANPGVTASIKGEDARYIARELEGEEYEHYWQCATETYSGYPKYKERVSRSVPVMLLEPVE